VTESGPPDDLRTANGWFARFIRTSQEGATVEEDIPQQ
jgi:hypothetical protein